METKEIKEISKKATMMSKKPRLGGIFDACSAYALRRPHPTKNELGYRNPWDKPPKRVKPANSPRNPPDISSIPQRIRRRRRS